jgi:CHAT domain-containing protein
LLERFVEEGATNADQQLARVRWVCGDLLRVGNTNDEQRFLAVESYSLALEQQVIAQRYASDILMARGQALSEISNPNEKQIEMAIEDFYAAIEQLSKEPENRVTKEIWRAYFNLGQFLFKYKNDTEGAIKSLQLAATFALHSLNNSMDEAFLIHQSEKITPLFEKLARFYCQIGWEDLSLGLLEITRGITVRLYTADEDREKEIYSEFVSKSIPQLYATKNPEGEREIAVRYGKNPEFIDDYLEDCGYGEILYELLNYYKDDETGLLAFFLDENVIGAIICTLETENDQWRATGMVWDSSKEELDSLTNRKYLAPGPFREKKLNELCEKGFKTLIEPIENLIEERKLKRIMISVPGYLNRIPFEALINNRQRIAFDELNLSTIYIPSVRLGCDLLRIAGKYKRTITRVLVVGYDGKDLNNKEREIVALQKIWGERLTVLPGNQCTKERVLKELNNNYDLVHIQGHGTYSHTQPFDSAIHFVPDTGNDRRRVTALDLLANVHFTHNPIVILSACSSAMTVDDHTNSYHGLLGSLLRIGAVGVIGTRWPIHDDAALRFIELLHQELIVEQYTPDRCLALANSALRKESAYTEDWAAFGYFGMV